MPGPAGASGRARAPSLPSCPRRNPFSPLGVKAYYTGEPALPAREHLATSTRSSVPSGGACPVPPERVAGPVSKGPETYTRMSRSIVLHIIGLLCGFIHARRHRHRRRHPNTAVQPELCLCHVQRCYDFLLRPLFNNALSLLPRPLGFVKASQASRCHRSWPAADRLPQLTPTTTPCCRCVARHSTAGLPFPRIFFSPP